MLKRLLLFVSIFVIAAGWIPLAAESMCKITRYDKLRKEAWAVRYVLQDNNGLLWFSTSNGLYRFDGYEFMCFKSKVGDGLPMLSDDIKHTYQDVRGNLWCLIDNRAFLFDVQQCQWIDVLKKLENETGRVILVKKIRTMPNGQIWLISMDGTCIVMEAENPIETARVATDKIKDTDTYISIDPQGNTWLFTSDASYLYGSDSLKRYEKVFISSAVADGVMWLVDKEGKLYCLDNVNYEIKPKKIPANMPKAYYAVKTVGRDRIAVFAHDAVYLTCKAERFHRIDCGRRVERLFEDGNCNMWVQTTDHCLLKMEADSHELRLISDNVKKNTYIYEDKFGTLWLIGRDGRLRYIVDGTDEIKEGDAGGNNLAGCGFFADNQGCLWMVNDYSVYKMTFHQRSYSVVTEDKLTHVKGLYKDKKGRLWLADRNHQTVKLFDSDNVFLGYLGTDGILHKEHVKFANVYSVCHDKNGQIWLGCKPNGLYRLKENNGSFTVDHFVCDINDVYSLSANVVYDIKEDGKGRIWIATHGGGINCVEQPEAVNVKFANFNNVLSKYKEPYNSKIYNIAFTRDNVMLAASNEGLLVADISKANLEDMVFKLHQREADREMSLSNSCVRHIIEDTKNRIFVCTENGGLNQIVSDNLLADKLDFKHYSCNTGFPTDIAQCVVEYDGKLWVVGRNMLIELDPDEKKQIRANSYLETDSLIFSGVTPVELGNGRWMFGLQYGGALVVDLKQLGKSTFIPKIVLTKVKKNDCDLYSYSDTIVLDSKERSLNIIFSALDYTDTENIDYAYSIATDDSYQHNYIGNSRRVAFVDMHPGEYKLTLHSTNGQGVWVDNHRTLTIIVIPTFWETPWAYLLYLLTIIGIGYSIVLVRHHIKKIKKQREESLESYLKLLDQNEKEQKAYDEKRRELQARNSQVYDDICMQRVISFIKDNIGNPNMSIDDVAAFAAVSRSALNRKVKQNTGVTPLEFIKTIRIQRACQMLKEEQYTVNEVAYECGFSDPKYFSKCFKSVIGLTPTDYRLKNLI